MQTVAAPKMTAESLLAAGESLGRCELIRGEVISMSPVSPRHGRVMMKLGRMLDAFVERHQIGMVFGGDAGFVLERNPDTVRAPDLAFVRMARLQGRDLWRYFEGSPDLAVEVNSPSDQPKAVAAKAAPWLDAGAEAVWVVDAASRTVTAYASGVAPRVLGEADTLTGGDLLPGFSVAVAVLFED